MRFERARIDCEAVEDHTQRQRLYRRLWNDEQLRMICDIEKHEKPYHPSQLTRFRNKVGPESLEAVMNRAHVAHALWI